MRILHVIDSLATRYGGPSVACPALCKELARQGHRISVYTTNVDGDQFTDVPLDRPVWDAGVEFRYFQGWTYPPGYKFSMPLWAALKVDVRSFDVAHVYSVFSFSTWAASHHCRKHGVPYLLHPHGSLDPFLRRRHPVRKWLYTSLVAKRCFRHASALLFNSSEEMRLASGWPGLPPSAVGSQQAPRNVIVYVGVEDEWFRPASPASRENFRKKFPELEGRRLLLFYGRLSFKKGLDSLTAAFVQLAKQVDDVHLVLAGPDFEGYGARVRRWLGDAELIDKATFTGTLVGDDRFAAMQEAAVFVLPSYTENFGQSVAEAMASGVPVVISNRVNIWPEVAGAKAGLVVECDARSTAQAIRTLLQNPDLGQEMGARGRHWARRNLTWDSVAEQMSRVYHAMIDGHALQQGRSPCPQT